MAYTITHNKDMLNKLSNFTYVTIFDMMMGYYDISLTDAAKKVCTITTPFGKYKYNHLQMGVYISLGIFQEIMRAITNDLEFVRVYLEISLIIISGSFEEHLSKVEEVMKQLQLTGIKCRIDKCKFSVPK